MTDFFRTVSQNTATLLVAIAMVLVSTAVHVGLYGWHRAPVYRVTLRPRQWLGVALVLALPTVGAVLLVIFRERLLQHYSGHRLQGAMLALIGLLVAALYGLAPSGAEEGDEE